MCYPVISLHWFSELCFINPIAYLAQCHPLAAVVVSFLFGGLLVGGNTIQKLGLPVSTVQMIQGSILIFVAAGGMFTKYRIVRKERRLGND